MGQNFILFCGWITIHCTYGPLFGDPFLPWWTLLNCFHLLAIVNDVAIGMDMQISSQLPVFNFFGYISRSCIAGSHDDSTFSFLRNCQTLKFLLLERGALHFHSALGSAKWCSWPLLSLRAVVREYQGLRHIRITFGASALYKQK